jgi:hypothetical protein
MVVDVEVAMDLVPGHLNVVSESRQQQALKELNSQTASHKGTACFAVANIMAVQISFNTCLWVGKSTVH